MAHHCHATDCTVPVPPEMFMCRQHWFTLPHGMRAAIWRTYRAGQCDDHNPSRDYLLTARRAVQWLAWKEDKVPDVRLYDMMLAGLERQA